MTRRKPLDPDLYAAVVDEAKARFAVWPSAYASGWVVKTYKARGGRYAGQGRKESTGLTKWFGEEWVDLSRPTADGGYEPCGRKKSNDPADYPKCRPLKEALRMTSDQVADAVRRKRRAEAGAPARGSRARSPKRVATYRENPGFVFDWEIPGTRGIREVNIEGVTVLYGYDGKSAHLASIRTRTKDQGKGKARAVLERFCEEADALGIPIKLEASPLTKKVNRGRLVAFYESLGFVKTGRTINPAGDPEMVRPPRRANPEGIDGDALAAWCASDESYAVLDETASAGSSWMAGACVLLAKALVATHPEAQLVGLEVDGDVQHVGALVGDVVYDALGAHSERRWARDWLAYEQLDPRTPARLVSLEGVPASALPDAEAPATARDVRLVARALPA